MADEQRRVGGDATLPEFGDIVGKAVEAEILLAADSVKGGGGVLSSSKGARLTPQLPAITVVTP